MVRTRPDGGRPAGRATVDSEHPGSVQDLTDVGADWSWPPYAPVEDTGEGFDTPDWAPASVVRHPRLRLGRRTGLYPRGC